MSFKMTVEIRTTGDECWQSCRFLRDDPHTECTLFQKRLKETGNYPYTSVLRCADCKKAEKAAEKANG